MRRLFFALASLMLLLVMGCSNQAMTKYQCVNGDFVDSESKCESLRCSESASCEPNIEYQEKIVEKRIDVLKIICADGKAVTNETQCIDYISTWNISANKQELITKLENIQNIMDMDAVTVTKLAINEKTIEISYTQKDAEFMKEGVGQTMYEVMKTTANYLKDKKKLDYNIKIIATTSNGGNVFSKTTSQEDILKILDYELGMDEWIEEINQDKGFEMNY